MSASDQMRAMLAQLMGTNCEGEWIYFYRYDYLLALIHLRH